MRITRTRRIVGWLTLFTLLAILIGVSGFQIQIPHVGGSSSGPALQGVRALAADTLLRVGSGAPPGGELAFLAVEPSGNLLVSDSKRRSVMQFDPTGHLLSDWGPTFGTTQLGQPAGVAISGTSYYVIDRGTPRVLQLNASGQLQGVIDLESLGTYGLNGLNVDSSGNLYVADTGRNRVLVLSPSGQVLKQIGHAGSDLGGFTQPMMLAFASDGSFFVADWENGRIERWDSSYQATDAWSLGFNPFGVAVDGTGRVFVPDADHRRIEAYTPQGAQLGEIGQPNNPTLGVAPKQIAVAPSGQLSVYVLGTDAIQRVDLENTVAPSAQVSPDQDLVGIVLIVLMIALVGLAMLARRQRRAEGLLGTAADRPVRLHAEDGAERQQQQPKTDEDLLVAYKSEGKKQSTD